MTDEERWQRLDDQLAGLRAELARLGEMLRDLARLLGLALED